MQRLTLYRGLTLAALAIALCTLAVSGAFATALPITDSGVLSISNLAGSLVGITNSPACINWGGGSTCVAGTTHQYSVGGISNLFSVIVSTTDQIKDLPGVTSVTDFETVLGAGVLTGQTVHFDLTSLPLTNGGAGFGNCGSNAALNSCSPAGSIFTFSEDSTGTQVSLSFSALMNAYTGTSASGTTAYRGIFTTQISGTLSGSGSCLGLTANITNILTCEASGGTITNTWSASESPAPSTPEPGTLLLMGSGLAGLAGFVRRFKRS